MEQITGRANERVKYAVKLRESAAFRREEQCFFLEGARLSADALRSGAEIITAFVTEKAMAHYPDEASALAEAANNAFLISGEVSEKLSDTKNPQGVFCVCKMLDKCANIGKIKYNGKYVVLETVSNPLNLGAVCRTAEALGIDGVIVGGGCDIFHPKAQRAAMGSLLRLSVFAAEDLISLLTELTEKGMKLYASVPANDAQSVTDTDFSGGILMAVGNEGNGLSRELIDISSKKITIPMAGRAESFNASAAASILMWEMMR